MIATSKTFPATSRRLSGGAAGTSKLRVSANAVASRLPPGLQTVEDFRVSSHSMQDLPQQPNLPPALQSMEAFKTRKSFLTGKCGFDNAKYRADASAASTQEGNDAEWQDPLSLTFDMSDHSSSSESETIDALDSLTFDLFLDGDDTDTEGDIY